MLKALLNDEAGSIVCIELVLVGTVLGVGLLTGLTAVRNATVSELAELTAAASMDQSFSLRGIAAHSSATADSIYTDVQGDSSSPAAARCLIVSSGEGSANDS
jgi:hypothetical protein